MQGFNALLTGGVSVNNSQTITCPQTTIVNDSNPGAGVAFWEYGTPAPGTSELIVFYSQWIWEVPFSSYSANQTTVNVNSEALSSFMSLCVPFQSCPTFTAGLQSVVPLPFGDTFVLKPPVVKSVSPTCANAGSTFVITGTGMYPSLVTSVLIGGVALDPSQYTTNSDTSITVVAPEESGDALSVVVQTAEGLSNADVTIEISVIDLCNL